jgi:vacuole morphology and inheritance protein 14
VLWLTETEEEIKLTSLRWIDSFFEIAPEDILSFIPRLLSQVLPAMSNDVEQVRHAANKVNTSLMNYILSLPEEDSNSQNVSSTGQQQAPAAGAFKDSANAERRESTISTKIPRPIPDAQAPQKSQGDEAPAPTSAPDSRAPSPRQTWNVDYEATVNALTLQFLNEHEATRVAALNWLIMLHRKSPPGRKVHSILHATGTVC